MAHVRTLAFAAVLLDLLATTGCSTKAPSSPESLEPERVAKPAARQTLVTRPPTPVRILPPAPRAESLLTAPAHSTATNKAVAKTLGLIVKLRDSVETTAYQARTEVDKKTGHYAWDCSGMTNWILKRTARRAFRSVGKSRPRAIDYYNAIKRAPTKRQRRGWERLGHISDARPGDVFAFPRSPLSRSKISGHVGFFVGRPWRVLHSPVLEPGQTAWAARILDATGLPHQDDTRARDSEGGFGFGTFLFITDESGETISYGWFGTRSRGTLPTNILYGRVHR